jgi:twitching motility two-component system response regulator PilG
MKKVLIVEDSPTTRAVVKVYLTGQKLDFLEANNGEDGLQMARQQRPDVIVLDLKMPGIDGFTFCRALRADPQLRDTPVILLTGTRGAEVEAEAMAAGASLFLNKPIDGQALATAILSAVESRR